MQWQFFQNLYQNLITPDLAAMAAMLGGMCAAVQLPAWLLIGLWLCISFFELGSRGKSKQAFFKDIFIASMIVWMLQVGQYTAWVADLFLQGIPNTFSAALGGAPTPVSALDNTLAQVLTGAFKTYEALPSYSLKTIPLAMALIVYIGFAAIQIVYVFGIYMIAALINVLAISVGPIFLALMAIPPTRRFATGWLGVLVGGCVTQLLTMAIVQLMSAGELLLIQQVSVSAQASNSNSIAMLWGLCQIGLLLWLTKEVVKEIPSIARAIGGGVHHHGSSAAVQAATLGAAAAVTSIAISSVTSAVGKAFHGADNKAPPGPPGAGTGWTSGSAPTGKSLSGATS